MPNGRKPRGQASHRTPEKRLEDQEKMWRLIARNPKLTQKKIAVELGISQQMVSRDYELVRNQFLERRNESVELWLGKMIAGYDLQIEEAWAEFERSKQDREVTSQSAEQGKAGNKQVAAKRTEGRIADVRFLDHITKCREQQAKLLGLYAPEKKEVTGSNGGPIDLREASEDELDERIAQLLSRSKQITNRISDRKSVTDAEFTELPNRSTNGTSTGEGAS
jgi:predicted transcriptional regulator